MDRPFVILHHTGYGEAHYDLMVQNGDVLATWQAPVDPTSLAVGQSVALEKLPDHRLAYLTYEGPIRGGRGSVRRIEGGQADVIERTDSRWHVRLAGEQGSVEMELKAAGEGQWRCTRVG